MQSLYKLSLALKGYPVYRACRDWKAFRQLPPEKRQTALEAGRIALVRYFQKHSAPYAELLKDWDGKWENIPVMSKDFLRSRGDALLSNEFDKKALHRAATSGSSGYPLVIYRDKYGHAMIWAYILESFARRGIRYGTDCQGRFFGFPDQEGHAMKTARRKDFLANRVTFPSKKMSEEYMESALALLAARGVTYLYGYTSSLMLFCGFLKRRNAGTLHALCPKIKCVFFTSEVCLPEEQEQMREIFGVPVIGEYGAIDAGIIGYQLPDGAYEVNDGQIFLEVVDDENRPLPDGVEGKFLVTALYNHALPVIRYELGDRGTLGMRDGRRVILSLGGRLADYILKRDGTKIPALSTYNAAKMAAMKFPQIVEYYARQTDYEKIDFELVLSEGEITPEMQSEFAESMKTCLGREYEITVAQVPEIRRTKAGKMKRLESCVKQQ